MIPRVLSGQETLLPKWVFPASELRDGFVVGPSCRWDRPGSDMSAAPFCWAFLLFCPHPVSVYLGCCGATQSYVACWKV